jgi:predicted transcriptional regulator
MIDSKENTLLLTLTTQIVTAFVGRQQMPAAELTNTIRLVHDTLRTLGQPGDAAPLPHRPAVPLNRSITPDHLICLEDGKRLKTLKRHLRAAYNLTPDQYRARWGLPPDYPMVAPNYAKRRSHLAKSQGLGRQSRRAAR